MSALELPHIAVVGPFVPAFPSSGSPTRTFCLCRELQGRFRFSLFAGLAFGQAEDSASLACLDVFDKAQIVNMSARKRLPRENAASRLLRLFWGSADAFRTFKALGQELQTRLSQTLEDLQPQIIEFEEVLTSMWLIDRRPHCPILINAHNLLFVLARRSASNRLSWRDRIRETIDTQKLTRQELSIYRAADAVAVCSEIEKELLTGLLPKTRIEVVPNGVCTRYFGLQAEGDPERLLFTGKMDYGPNIDALRFFAERILPIVRLTLPNIKFDVVGMCPGEEIYELGKLHNFLVHGNVPDIRPYFEAAGILVAPLRLGAGTRLKILEALSLGRPVVSTRVGAEGLECIDGQHLLLADNAVDFAASIIELTKDSGLRSTLRINGRAFVEKQYDWAVLAPRLGNLYRALL